MVWCLFKHKIGLHGVVLYKAKDVSIAWCLIKHRIRLHGVVLN